MHLISNNTVPNSIGWHECDGENKTHTYELHIVSADFH